MRQQAHVRPSWSVGRGACPRALGAKRVRVRIREKEGFKHYRVWRAPCYQVPKRCQKLLACTLGTLTCRRLERVSLLGFFARLQRNDVLPRTVVNSGKENSQLTQTTSCRKQQRGINPNQRA